MMPLLTATILPSIVITNIAIQSIQAHLNQPPSGQQRHRQPYQQLIYSFLISITTICTIHSIINHFSAHDHHHPPRTTPPTTAKTTKTARQASHPHDQQRLSPRFKTSQPIIINSILLILDHLFLLSSISNLSILRFIILTTCSSRWSRSISDLIRAVVSKPLAILALIPSPSPALDLASPGVLALLMLITCLTIDLIISPLDPSDLTRLKIGYFSIFFHLVFRGLRITNLQVDKIVYRNQTSISLIATLISLFLTLITPLLLSPSSLHPITQPNYGMLIGYSMVYAIISHLSIDRLFYSDHSSSTLDGPGRTSDQVLSWIVIGMITSELIGNLFFDHPIGNLSDRLVASVCYLGISSITTSVPTLKSIPSPSMIPTSHLRMVISPKTTQINTTTTIVLNPFDKMNQVLHRTKSVIKTILGNPESRNIYFFLCLNLAFMLVQMMYGIWTNSLGLISDSIHMFFDCMALGMGLFASVMATWPPDDQFTYGYGRVETLSGFGNGIFLMLISIFIIFEAIQRLINPPNMNTNQLLTVSFIGLMVNLVGMFATGHHHHHHGHSHGHDHHHDHDHGHSHNMKGVFLHVMADTLGSVGVIISTLLIERYGWTGFDPIASIFIAALIFASVVPLVQDSARILMLSLDEHQEGEIRKALGKLSTIEGLSSYSAPRFWPKDSTTISGSIHLQLGPMSMTTGVSRLGVGLNEAESSLRILSQEEEEEEKEEKQAGIAGLRGGKLGDRLAEKVKTNVQNTLAEHIPGLTELIIQIEATDGSRNCPCLTSLNPLFLHHHHTTNSTPNPPAPCSSSSSTLFPPTQSN